MSKHNSHLELFIRLGRDQACAAIRWVLNSSAWLHLGNNVTGTRLRVLAPYRRLILFRQHRLLESNILEAGRQRHIIQLFTRSHRH